MKISKTKVWIAIIISWTFALVGCSHGIVSEDFDYPLVDIQNALLGSFKTGVIQREARKYELKPFRPAVKNEKFETPLASDEVRAKAEITIVGNERPYVVRVRAFIEESETSNTWDEIEASPSLGEKIVEQILKGIERQGEKNAIDRYRPF